MRRLAIGVLAAAALTAGLGQGIAYASTPDVTGQKYSDAKTAISQAGLTPVVVTTVGDRKDWSNCLVSNVQQRTEAAPENSSGSSTKEALVSLNCDAAPASATTPGYSAASPEAKAIVAAAQAAKAKQEGSS